MIEQLPIQRQCLIVSIIPDWKNGVLICGYGRYCFESLHSWKQQQDTVLKQRMRGMADTKTLDALVIPAEIRSNRNFGLIKLKKFHIQRIFCTNSFGNRQSK